MTREPLPFQYPDSTSPGAEHDRTIVKMIDEGHSWADIEAVAGENAFDRYYDSLDSDLERFWTRETITRLNKVVEEHQSTTTTTGTTSRSLNRGIRDDNLPWEEIAATLDSRALICRYIWTTFGDGRPLSATELALVIAEKEEKEKKKAEEEVRTEAVKREMTLTAEEERKSTQIATKGASVVKLEENVALDNNECKQPRIKASVPSSSSSSSPSPSPSSQKALGLDIPAMSFCDRNHNRNPIMLSPPPSDSSSPMDQHFERHLIDNSGSSSFSGTGTTASLGDIFNSDPSPQCGYQGTRQERARRLVRLQKHRSNAKLLAEAVQQKQHQEKLYQHAVQRLLNTRKILSSEHKWRMQAIASTGSHTHPSSATPGQSTLNSSSTTDTQAQSVSPQPLVIHDSSAEEDSVFNATSTESTVIDLTEDTNMDKDKDKDKDVDMDVDVDIEEPVAPEPPQSVLFPQHKPTGLAPLPNTNPYYDVLTWTAEDVCKTWQSWGQMGDNWEYISTRVLQGRHSPQACRAFVMGAGMV